VCVCVCVCVCVASTKEGGFRAWTRLRCLEEAKHRRWQYSETL